MAYTDIDDPSAYFQTAIWSGTGSALSVTFDGNSDMQPDMVWVKNRTVDSNHRLSDSVRGTSSHLVPDDTAAQDNSSTALTAFNSDGFSVGSEQSYSKSGSNHVGWAWKETADAGFDIVSYTGSGSAKTVSHSLSAVPKMIIVKSRSATGQWAVQHASLGATHWIELQATAAADSSAAMWNDTNPTSSVFTVGTNARTNANGTTYIAYVFAEKQGYSKIGSYIGTGSDVFIHTGFKVGWLLVKVADGTNGWLVIDTKRSPANPQGKFVYANASSAEGTVTYGEFFSNGFGWKGTNSIAVNQSGKKYIYYAIAENPFVTSTGVPATAR